MHRTLLAALGLVSSTAWATATAPHYTLELLGDLPGGMASSQGMAINADGLVGGQSVSGDGYFATQWAPGARTPVSLGDLPGGNVSSMVYGVNDSGTFAGTAGASSGIRAFRSTAGGAMVDLGDLPGGSNASGAWALNNAGTVVGYSYSSVSGSNPTAVVWGTDGTALDLGDLAGGLTSSQAKAINDAGAVAGVGSVAAGKHAFLWTAGGGLQDLGDLAGGSEYSEAAGINEDGWVVGYGVGSSNTLHATLWRDGQVIDLGSGSVTSSATDVNNHGLVVGASGGRATLWTADLQAVDLNTVVDGLPQGFVLGNALAINDQGQITGWGSNAAGQRVGFVLSEVAAVPEPGSWALMLAGLLATGSLACRRRAAV